MMIMTVEDEDEDEEEDEIALLYVNPFAVRRRE